MKTEYKVIEYKYHKRVMYWWCALHICLICSMNVLQQTSFHIPVLQKHCLFCSDKIVLALQRHVMVLWQVLLHMRTQLGHKINENWKRQNYCILLLVKMAVLTVMLQMTFQTAFHIEKKNTISSCNIKNFQNCASWFEWFELTLSDKLHA
jgi:hypothetical protein